MRFNGKTAIVTIDHVSPPSMDPIERYRLPREKWPSYSLPTVHANPGALMPQVSSRSSNSLYTLGIKPSRR